MILQIVSVNYVHGIPSLYLHGVNIVLSTIEADGNNNRLTAS